MVVQKQERNVQKSVMHVRSCCLGLLNQLFFFYVLLAVHVVGSLSPYYIKQTANVRFVARGEMSTTANFVKASSW